ncbi:MAG: 30S ribosomal protein S6 [Verrucomicrobiota bacterium]
MKRKYEGVIVLNMQGQEEGIEESVNVVTKEFEGKGATLEQIERLGRKEFTYPNHAKQTHGYYVQYHFEAEPELLNDLETSLKLNDSVMLQHYRRR